MSATGSGSAPKAASIVLQSKKRMRHPGLANLFKAIVIGRSSPRPGGRGHSHRGSNRRKSETRRAGDIVTAIGRVVIHVALPRVGLAPGVFMRAVVLNFEVVRRARVHRCIQVGGIHDNPMRCPGVSVAGVIICSRWEDAGEGIHPGA